MTTEDQNHIVRRVSIADVDDVLPEIGLSLTVQVVRPVVTANEPARIRITSRNASDKEQVFTTGYMKVFGEYLSQDNDPGLVLLPPDTPLRFTNRSLRLDNRDITYDTTEVINHLQPDETDSIEYEIWDAPHNTGEPLAPKTYRFECAYHRQRENKKSEDTFCWGFDISVK